MLQQPGGPAASRVLGSAAAHRAALTCRPARQAPTTDPDNVKAVLSEPRISGPKPVPVNLQGARLS